MHVYMVVQDIYGAKMFIDTIRCFEKLEKGEKNPSLGLEP